MDNHTRTVIELGNEILFHTTEYSFVPFDEFHKYIDLNDPIGKICKVHVQKLSLT